MEWNDNLLDEQIEAASHFGKHARMLAGPGTGKTLTMTRRAVYLIKESGVEPSEILALTFTRAAASELRSRISDALKDQNEVPQVSTLHSFALRQLLLNSDKIDSVPNPVRIADDWEERWIIYEDLKETLGENVTTIREKFSLLSSDWETLAAEGDKWEEQYRDPRFLGAWQNHRRTYGYTLRSELVYQLKRSLQQSGNFELETDYSHILVDEYQDLNRCDMAVVSSLRDRGAEVFVAGDDDQSIYGFRQADPIGIRVFDREYESSKSLTLSICVRCDRKIIQLALFVANLDPYRIDKPLEPRKDADEGEVQVIRFRDQFEEAIGVASICRNLIDNESFEPNDVLILMRSDRYNAFSKVVREALANADVPATINVGGSPLDYASGRIFLSILRLLFNNSDSLAWRTLFQLRDNNLGSQSFSNIFALARKLGVTFFEAAAKIKTEPGLIVGLGKRISKEMYDIESLVDAHRETFDSLGESDEPAELFDAIQELASDVIGQSDERNAILAFLKIVISDTGSKNLGELLRGLSITSDSIEQELDPDSVNIMTMHKAKGLTANAVIIVAAEDEYIPGRQEGNQEDDERRLLYVSLTRAKHFLAVTYAERRKGQQRHTGRTGGKLGRTLTRFLRDAPIKPMSGEDYLNELKNG